MWNKEIKSVSFGVARWPRDECGLLPGRNRGLYEKTLRRVGSVESVHLSRHTDIPTKTSILILLRQRSIRDKTTLAYNPLSTHSPHGRQMTSLWFRRILNSRQGTCSFFPSADQKIYVCVLDGQSAIKL